MKFIVLSLALMLSVVSCNKGTDNDVGTGSMQKEESRTDYGTGSGQDMGSGSGTDMGTGSESDMDVESDMDSETGTDTTSP